MSEPHSVSLKNKQELLIKVPEISLIFWITKILTTGMGEVFSDYLATHINPFIAVTIGAIGFVISLMIQFSARRYIPWIYWLAVVMVSIFGTMAADVLHVGLGIPYIVSTTIYVILLALVFLVWYLCERTLSIHSINTRRREMFYWATVLFTFALGTAAGDMTASTMHLGYFESGILFAVLFALPGLAKRIFGLNDIFAFWFAYVMTRPLGASFADWISLPHARGGLGAGTGLISLALTILIIGLVGYLTVSHKDSKQDV